MWRSQSDEEAYNPKEIVRKSEIKHIDLLWHQIGWRGRPFGSSSSSSKSQYIKETRKVKSRPFGSSLDGVCCNENKGIKRNEFLVVQR